MILYSDIFAKRSQKSNFFKNYFWAFIDLWGHRPWCWNFFEITWSLCILIFIMISCRVRDIQSCKVTKAKFAMLPSYLVTDKVSYRGTPFLKTIPTTVYDIDCIRRHRRGGIRAAGVTSILPAALGISAGCCRSLEASVVSDIVGAQPAHGWWREVGTIDKRK